MSKGDLISREAVINAIADTILNGESLGYVLAEEIVSEIPSADIIEHARAIKDYCEKYDEHCVGCPFNSAKPTLWCALGGSSLPHEWDLPEVEKGGDV